jgi:hypothetical protein
MTTPIPALARCPVRGCFQRYRGGPDRLCPEHQRSAGMGELASADLMQAPTGDQRRAQPVTR